MQNVHQDEQLVNESFDIELLPEEKLFLLYLLRKNKKINELHDEFAKAGFIDKDELITREYLIIRDCLKLKRKRDAVNGERINIDNFAIQEGMDIFELSKLLLMNNIMIQNGFVDKRMMYIALGREKEIVMPANKKTLERISFLLGNYLNKKFWNGLTSSYNLIYGDTDFPTYQGYLEVLNKPKLVFKEKSKISCGGKLVKRVYEEWKDHKSIKKLINRFRLSEDTIKQLLTRFGVIDQEFIENELQDLESIVSKDMLGLKVYNGKSKQRIREIEVKEAQAYLKKKRVSYLGLEGNNFISYILFRVHLNLAQKRSLIPERDQKRANIMEAIVDNYDLIKGGKIFKGLNIYHGELLDALKEDEYNDLRFNLLNLDYEGGWSLDKEETIKLLFEKDKLENKSMLFMILNDTALERMRVIKTRGKNREGYSTTNQYKLVCELLTKYTKKYNFNLDKLFLERYSDTVHSMIAFGFKINKLL
jgi:hypothetical protein